jgi:hypothetical protein
MHAMPSDSLLSADDDEARIFEIIGCLVDKRKVL